MEITYLMHLSFSGSYSSWNSEDKSSSDYCPATPFMMAFIILIFSWIFFGLILIIIVIVCLLKMFKKKPTEEKMDENCSNI